MLFRSKYNNAINYHEAYLKFKAENYDHDAIKEYQSFIKLRQNDFKDIPKNLTFILESLHKRLYVKEYFAKIKEEGAGNIQ